MLAKKKRNLIIIITSIILGLLIIIATLITLYLTTDMFKSNSVLFAKYIVQNIENMDAILKANPSEIEQMIEQDKLTTNLKATVSYKDEDATENSINKAELDISGEIDKL